MKDEDGLVATLLGPSQVNSTVKGKKVSIESITSYPYAFDFRFKINTTEGNRFSIKIRKPDWAIVAYTSLPCKEENGYLVFTKSWKQQDELLISFEAVVKKINTAGDECYFQYGPLVLCHQLASTEVITKTYAIPGLKEFNCLPLGKTVFEYDGALPLQDTFHKNRFSIEMQAVGKNQPEKISIVPMAGTILRQVTFKKKGP